MSDVSDVSGDARPSGGGRAGCGRAGCGSRGCGQHSDQLVEARIRRALQAASHAVWDSRAWVLASKGVRAKSRVLCVTLVPDLTNDEELHTRLIVSVGCGKIRVSVTDGTVSFGQWSWPVSSVQNVIGWLLGYLAGFQDANRIGKG